jgi:multidrug efflux pump subunit AcrB
VTSPEERAAKEREHAHDAELVAKTHNTARYFTENRQVAWVALLFVVSWGVYGYLRMPKAKDPTIEVRVAVATCQWPGADSEKIEQLVTRKIEQKLAENSNVEKIESISRTNVSIVYVTLKENAPDCQKEWDDVQGRLEGINDLPAGAGPVVFQKDFGDTATLMLTVASPKASDVEVELRARSVAHAIERVRTGAAPGPRATLVVSFPPSMNSAPLERVGLLATHYFDGLPGTGDTRLLRGPGFLGIDLATNLDDAALAQHLLDFARTRMRLSELHPDVWPVTVVRDPKDTRTRLQANAGDRYTYRELDDYTDTIKRYLQRVPIVSKVSRSGVLPEQVNLDWSQERLAQYGLQQSNLGPLLEARNITAPGGALEIAGKNVVIDPSGEFLSDRQIGDVLVTTSGGGPPVYLRDLVDVSRDYVSPARFLNYISARGPDGAFVRSRAITLAVNMRRGEQVADFGAQVDAELARVRALLPEDLVIHRTSDQALQVREGVRLFMNSLYEAIVLVVIVALVGFWEWRMALLLALAIPITLAMTFGMMNLAGLDIQQVSIASLILALGLLVDDPVVAGDAIKRALADGWKPLVAAWLGPTKLATAILFATITNIAAYLPFLSLPGDTGKFIYSLPIVLTLSLVASRIVSMTFIPLLGSTLLRAPRVKEPSPHERRARGFGKFYSSVVGWAIDHRLAALLASVLLLVAGGFVCKRVKPAFFPKDLSYLSYVDVWLPEDATLSQTRDTAQAAVQVIREACEDYGKLHPLRGEAKREILESVTEFDGGGAPRFWFSVSPELQQLNYAQLIVQVRDKEDTAPLAPFLQERLSRLVPGARIDVRQLENGKPVGIPVAVRISGEDIGQLRLFAEKAKAIFRSTPGTERARDDWGNDNFSVNLEVDPDRANLAGITNLDVARSSAVAMSGTTVSRLRENDKQIPIVARLRGEERSQLEDVQNLYVTSSSGPQSVPLRAVSRISYRLMTEKIRRRNQFRTITVSAFPAQGLLPSETLMAAMPQIEKLKASLPPGMTLEVGGEQEEQVKGFASLLTVLVMSLGAIFLALVVQFRSAVKPWVVFAALPYGAVAAVVSLVVADAPFSFMAFLGIISLMGVIVSHIIVLFDFIEEMHHQGEPLREALIDAGILRLRPVLITVGATVLGLIPLAMHGGPLWEPLCYAQIGGLTVATSLTLLLVPVIYTIFVRDLRWIRWEEPRVAP